MPEDNDFLDPEQYRGEGDKELDFQLICLRHLAETIRSSSKELKEGGYWSQRMVGNRAATVYVPDEREILCNSIKSLRTLLLPHFDKEAVRGDEVLHTKMRELDSALTNHIKDAGINPGEGINPKSAFYQEYINKKLAIHSNFFDELSKLLFRCSYMQNKRFVRDKA